jgi:hypothetical protein
MVIDIPYKSLKHTLQSLKVQVEDSMPYIGDYIPSDISTPEELFYFLRDITKYKKDPKNVELLQTVQTLMDRNGRGDCDCFTILALAACTYLGFDSTAHPLQVALVGKSNRTPSHIYSLVWDKKKKKYCSMDLTNPYYCMERPYPYKQTLDFMMTLRLEDNGPLLSKRFSLKKLNPLKRSPEKKAAIKEKKTIKRERKTAKKVGRQKRKLRKVQQKDIRKNRRMDARAAKAEAKVIRREKKAERKVNRATSRTDRAQDRQAVRKQRVANRMIRATGRGEIIARRQSGRLDKVDSKFSKFSPEEEQEQQEASMNPEPSDPYTDELMPDDVEGGNYESDEETEDAEFEMMPDDEEEYENDPYDEGQMQDLSFAPFITGIIQGGKKLLTKVAQTQAGQAVQKGTSIYNEIQALKSQNQYLQQEVERESKKKYLYAGGGALIGAGLLYAVTRK